jgi:predicted nuclease of predicted toxin-antitoxin system
LRVLIDESLPIKLAREIAQHDAMHVRDRGWIGLRNGVLLRAAVDAGVSVVITADASMPFQQNLVRLGIAVIVVSGVRNSIEDVRPLLAEIVRAIEVIRPGEWLVVRPLRTDLIRDSLLATAQPDRQYVAT